MHQFQVVVRDGELLLRLRGSGFSRETEHALRAQLSRVLGPTPVKLEWLPELPRTALGKLLQVVDERRSGTGPGS
mgnify:FL=1